MSGNPFKIVISGEDKGIIKLLQRVQVEFEGVSGPVKKTGDAIRKTSGNTGLEQFNKRLIDSKNAAMDMASGIERILPPIETLAALATVGGIADLAYRFGSLARQIQLTQKYTGLSTTEIQRWTGMAEAAGVAGGVMNDTINSFAQAIEGAVYGRNMDLKQFSVRMGVDLGEPGSVRGVDDVLRQVAEAISSNPDPKIKTAIISAFGLDNIRAFLIDGTKGLQDYAEMVKRTGVVQTPEQVALAASFNRTLIESRMAVEGLGNSIGAALVPAFQPLLSEFNQWIEQNREFLALRVRDDVIEIKNVIVSLGSAIDTGVTAVGGWHNAFRIMEIYLAGTFLASVLKTIAAINSAFVLSPVGRFFLMGAAVGYAVDYAHDAVKDTTTYQQTVDSVAGWLMRNGMTMGTGSDGADPVKSFMPAPADPRFTNSAGGAAGGETRHVIEFKNPPPGMTVTRLSPGDKESVLKILHAMPPGGN